MKEYIKHSGKSFLELFPNQKHSLYLVLQKTVYVNGNILRKEWDDLISQRSFRDECFDIMDIPEGGLILKEESFPNQNISLLQVNISLKELW